VWYKKTKIENNVQSTSQTHNNTHRKTNAVRDCDGLSACAVKCSESKPDQRFKVRERNLITVYGKVSRNDEPFATQKEIIVAYWDMQFFNTYNPLLSDCVQQTNTEGIYLMINLVDPLTFKCTEGFINLKSCHWARSALCIDKMVCKAVNCLNDGYNDT